MIIPEHKDKNDIQGIIRREWRTMNTPYNQILSVVCFVGYLFVTFKYLH